MARLLPFYVVAFLSPIRASEYNAQWTGNANQTWEDAANWDILQVPRNTETDSFNALLGATAGAVAFGSDCTINNLTIQHGAELVIANGRTLELSSALLDGGTLSSSPGGVARLSGGTHTCGNGGKFLVHDGSSLELAGLTVIDGSFAAGDLDTDPANHEVRIVANTTFSDGESRAAIRIDEGSSLILRGTEFANHSRILPQGGAQAATLFIYPNAFGHFLLSGMGEIQLDHSNDRIRGPSVIVHSVRQATGHRIRGGGTFTQLEIFNEGEIIADLPTVPLVISPYRMENDGGVVKAENGATLRLNGYNGNAFTSSNGGLWLIGDDSRFEIDKATLGNLSLSNDDLDGDPLNHEAIVTGDSLISNVVSETNLTVQDGVTLRIGGVFTNNGILQLESASAVSQIQLEASLLPPSATIAGNGVIRLDHPSDTIAGQSSPYTAPRLTHGPDHRIEGGGLINLDLVNHGTIVANLPGVPLRLATGSSFNNDGGLVLAENGATIRFENSGFTSINGGEYRIGDGSSFELHGAGLSGLTLSKDDLDADPANHEVRVTASSSLWGVTNEVPVLVQDGVTLTLGGPTFTNHGTIELGSASGISALSISGTGTANELVIGGTGSILLDSLDDHITAAPASYIKSLRHGAGHSIEGSGRLGLGRILINNEGQIAADRHGEQLIIDAFGPATVNRGVLRSMAGGILRVAEALEDTGGQVEVEAGSQLLVSGTMSQRNGSTLANGWLESTGFEFTGSTVQGTGTFNGPLTAAFSLVEPGNSTGTLTVHGNTTLATGSSLCIEVASASDRDLLAVTSGICQLDGATLRLDLLGNAPDLSNSDTLTILTSDGGLTGTFLNASDGDRLHTIDGLSSFVVRYSGNSVTLTDFAREPSSVANQPPIFTFPAGNIALDENTPPATLVATFHAYDPEGAIIRYSIADPTVPFTLDPHTGELKVSGPLNHEAQSDYDLTIGVSDGIHDTEMSLVIRLNDLADTNEEIVVALLTSPSGAFPGESDPAIIGFDADPDSDGLSNVFELWRGTNPAIADHPLPALLEPYPGIFLPPFRLPQSASVVIEVDPSVDDLLSVNALFSINLGDWRTAAANRIVLSDNGNIRRIRFFDTSAYYLLNRFFVRFESHPSTEP